MIASSRAPATCLSFLSSRAGRAHRRALPSIPCQGQLKRKCLISSSLRGTALRWPRITCTKLATHNRRTLGAATMKADPLENLMSKFDITGQTLALQRNGPTTEDRASSSAANDHEPEPEPHHPPRSASRRSQTSRSPRAPTPAPSGNKHARQSKHTRGACRSKPSAHKQLKHALSVNAAHVITHDYMMLSQPLSEVAPRRACPACPASPASDLLPPHPCHWWRRVAGYHADGPKRTKASDGTIAGRVAAATHVQHRVRQYPLPREQAQGPPRQYD